jgi:hypothetical protein
MLTKLLFFLVNILSGNRETPPRLHSHDSKHAGNAFIPLIQPDLVAGTPETRAVGTNSIRKPQA